MHSTGEFEITELASWGSNRDQRVQTIPWKFIGCTPDPQNEQEVNDFNSSPYNKFGAWKFEEACILSQPDYVIALRDAWHDQFTISSPFRKFYNLIWSPAVDSSPQKEEWLSWYKECDAVLTYTEWAKNVLDEASGSLINTVGAISPVCGSMYVPVNNKKEHKQLLGFPPDARIIGTVMRNQKRKDFPRLFEAFEQYVLKHNLNDTYLYCHTSYPDNGWDMPHLLKNSKVAHKIVFTYTCPNCGNVFPSLFRDGRTSCPKCMSMNACMPNTNIAVSDEVMAAIYNCFDVYVQYSKLEGLGMCQVEAASCGVPVMSTDYSAMSEVVRKLGGEPITVKTLDIEMESNRNWAIPDNDHLVSLLEKFFQQTPQEIEMKSLMVRQAFEEHYSSWEKVGKKWYDVIKSLPQNKLQWNNDAMIHIPSTNFPPQHCSNKEYVRWLIVDVLGEPERLGTFMEARLIRDLNFGSTNYHVGGLYHNDETYTGDEVKPTEFNRNHAYQHMAQLCERRNHWERIRVSNVK